MAEALLVIQSRAELPAAFNVMASQDFNSPHELILKPKEHTRTLSQNALFHMWMGELSRYLKRRGRAFATAAWCKAAMKHTFLGYREEEHMNVLTGELTVTRELVRTRDLKTAPMFYFMEQVEAWCSGIGCLLTIPETSDYMRLKRKQNQ